MTRTNPKNEEAPPRRTAGLRRFNFTIGCRDDALSYYHQP